LKPTRARNPLGPDFGDILSGLSVEHAVTRSVRDSAALLDATSGPDIGDPYWAPPLVRPLAEELGMPANRLRVAFTSGSLTGTPIHPDCIAAVREAAALCSEVGHHVSEAAPVFDVERLSTAFMTVWAVACSRSVDGNAILIGREPTPDQFEEFTWALAEQGRRINGASYLIAVNTLQFIARQISRFFLHYDVWLTPVLAEPPVMLGTFDAPPSNPLYPLERSAAFVPFTPICNATGQPAMSMPLCWNEAGLPIGTHFVGRFGDEATLFRLAAQLEAARPWALRQPRL
jgi:amidase